MHIWTPETDGERPARPPAERLRVGEGGDLQLTEAQRRRWGASPGVEFTVEETPYGLVTRSPSVAIACGRRGPFNARSAPEKEVA